MNKRLVIEKLKELAHEVYVEGDIPLAWDLEMLATELEVEKEAA